MYRKYLISLFLMAGLGCLMADYAPVWGQEAPPSSNVPAVEIALPEPNPVPVPVIVEGEGASGGVEVNIQPENVQAEASTPPAGETQRSIVIMSNVLDHLLSEQLGDDYRSRGVFSSGCRGYWVPDSGALFMLEVKFPLKDLKAPGEAKSPESKRDLWEQYEEQMSGAAPTAAWRAIDKPDQEKVMISVVSGESWFGGKVKFNPDKVEKLKAAVLTALARYGHRLQGIPKDETITVIIDGSSSEFGGEVFPMLESRVDRRVEKEADPGERMESMKLTLKEREDQFINRREYLDLVKKQVDLAKDRVQRTEQLVETGRVSQSELGEIQNQALESQKSLLEAEKSVRDAENQLMRAQHEFEMLKSQQERDQLKAKQELDQMKSQEEIKSKVRTLQEQTRIFKDFMLNDSDDRAKDKAEAELKDLQNQLSDYKKMVDVTLPQLRESVKIKDESGQDVFMNIESNPLVTRAVTLGQRANVEKAVFTMILRIPFKDIPKTEGEAKDFEGKVKITVY